MPYKDPKDNARWIAANLERVRECGRERSARWRAAHPEKSREEAAKRLRQKLEALAGCPRPDVCDYCGSDNGGRVMEFDHDHACCDTKPLQSCGRCFRAFLCSECNTRDVMASMPVPYMMPS